MDRFLDYDVKYFSMSEKKSAFEGLNRECQTMSELGNIKKMIRNFLIVFASIVAIEGITTEHTEDAILASTLFGSSLMAIGILETIDFMIFKESRENLRSLLHSSSGRDLDGVFNAIFSADMDPNDYR